jgi:iron complex transport system permease protein
VKSRRLFGLTLALLSAAYAGLVVGPIDLGPGDLWSGISGLFTSSDLPLEADVVANIRLPRVIAAILAGAALGVAGTISQGTYRNLIAEPYLLGISSAAGFGLMLGTFVTPLGSLPVVSLVLGAGIAVTVALGIQRFRDRLPYANGLILVGVAIGFTFLAWTLLVTYGVDSPRLPTFTYFIFGSLGVADWADVLLGLPFVVGGILYIVRQARRLDIFALGDREAASLGVDVTGLPVRMLVAMAVMVAASVLVAGVVGFVGLLSPVLGRRLVGSLHGALVPASALIGALAVLLADVGIRSTPFQVEIPLGVVTAAIGGPLLIMSLTRLREQR